MKQMERAAKKCEKEQRLQQAKVKKVASEYCGAVSLLTAGPTFTGTGARERGGGKDIR